MYVGWVNVNTQSNAHFMHIYREDFMSPKLARGRLQEKTGEIQQVG